MTAILVPFIALYTAVLTLMMGIGLLNTFLSLRMTLEGYSTQTTGLVLTAYYVGLILGNFLCYSLIRRVGHIRAFAAFAAMTTTMIMLHGLFMSPLSWALLRFITGVVTFGLYTVIESWLNECTPANARGRVFSIYLVMCYLGISIGQQLLRAGDPLDHTLFLISGLFVALCIVPIAVTRSIHPELPGLGHFRMGRLIRKAPVGVMGCLAAGLINSSVYAMGPVFGHLIHLSVSQISVFMSACILGGLLLQWPVGIISDRFDRAFVLFFLALILALFCPVVILAAGISYPALIAAITCFGGLVFAIYPVSVARTYDLFGSKESVQVSSALIFAYGLGAAAGPALSSGVMALSGKPHGFFLYIAAVSTLYAGITLFLKKTERIQVVPVDKQVDFMALRSTSTVAVHQDPRTQPMDGNNP
ncbi:MAG: MFS transporter [Pseudomonadota bacterium]